MRDHEKPGFQIMTQSKKGCYSLEKSMKQDVPTRASLYRILEREATTPLQRAVALRDEGRGEYFGPMVVASPRRERGGSSGENRIAALEGRVR